MSESDSDLLRRCRQGDDAAWSRLVSRHARRVFAIAYRFSGRVDEAEDLTQEIFVRVYERLHQYREEEAGFEAWLGAVARHHAIDDYRRKREERRRRIEAPGSLEVFESPHEGPHRSLERRERVEAVRRGLRALPSELREVLILCDLQGLAYDEIAASLSLPLGTVKSRINRGRLELAKRLLGRRSALGGRP